MRHCAQHGTTSWRLIVNALINGDGVLFLRRRPGRSQPRPGWISTTSSLSTTTPQRALASRSLAPCLLRAGSAVLTFFAAVSVCLRPGSALYIEGAVELSVLNGVFRSNRAAGSGGAVFVTAHPAQWPSFGTFTACQFMHNVAGYGAAASGALLTWRFLAESPLKSSVQAML